MEGKKEAAILSRWPVEHLVVPKPNFSLEKCKHAARQATRVHISMYGIYTESIVYKYLGSENVYQDFGWDKIVHVIV